MSRIRTWLLFARLVAECPVPTVNKIIEQCDVTRAAAQRMRREYIRICETERQAYAQPQRG